MPSNDPELSRRWMRFVVPAEVLGKIAKGEVTAERQLRGAKFLGAAFYHERATIEMFFERSDFPETRVGDSVPSEVLQVEPVIRIFH